MQCPNIWTFSFSEEAKLVDFESLIIVRLFLSKIICCLKSRPLNLLIVLINFFLLSFNFKAIFNMNDKFSSIYI